VAGQGWETRGGEEAGVSLTGAVFLGLVVTVTVALFVGGVVVMPRITPRGARSVVARAGVMLVVNLLVLLSATVALNDQFVFFADWTDLHGALFGGQVAAKTQAGAPASQAANAPLSGQSATAQPPVLPSLPVGAGVADRVLRYTVTGASSGLRGTILVTLPEGYVDPANAARRYPVLETFHGYPGDPSQWVDSMDLAGAIDTAVAGRAVGEMITISPTIEFPPGVDTECVDGSGSAPKVETWLTQDVPNWVNRTLRARTDRSSWAAIGLSAGAWCAAMATMLHPEQYGAGIVMGGYFAPEFSAGYVPFGPRSAAFHRYDLVSLARNAVGAGAGAVARRAPAQPVDGGAATGPDVVGHERLRVLRRHGMTGRPCARDPRRPRSWPHAATCLALRDCTGTGCG
jgi:hypothetical protein